MATSITARAHTNIALIKYWGKRDDRLFLPMNSSLSLTLDSFYTDTTVSFGTRDTFILNDVPQSTEETAKLTKFLDLFRHQAGIDQPMQVNSVNHVPTAAGLASSASAFAALGMAVNELTGLHLEKQILSTYVRQGSGSATRSLFGGFVEWQKGTQTNDSYALPIDDAQWDIGMLTIVVHAGAKTISSRSGMAHTVATSPFYPAWVTSCEQDLHQIKDAIWEKDLARVGEIMEENCLKMHATMLSARPPFWYLQPTTLQVMEKITELRRQGHTCYFTMDAGPNVKVLCHASEMAQLQATLTNAFPDLAILPSTVGPGAYIVE